jgi:hypothetical protein
MNSVWRFVGQVLTTGFCLFVLNAQAGELASEPARLAAAEHCLKAFGMQDVQPFKEMAKELSPEVVLDRVFSAVAPDFQKALLSRPADPAKPVKQPEAMRDPKYFLPAIATVPLSNPWVSVTGDGRVTEPAIVANRFAPDPNWARIPAESKGRQADKQGIPVPFFLPAPQRY